MSALLVTAITLACEAGRHHKVVMMSCAMLCSPHIYPPSITNLEQVGQTLMAVHEAFCALREVQ